MSKVLAANWMRLKKDKIFWIGMIFMAAAGIFFPIMKYTDMKESGVVNTLDNAFFSCALFIGILSAVFASLFIGTEYSDGTMRNKIVVGQKRLAIYFANLIVCAAAGLLMCIVFFCFHLAVGIPLLGTFTVNIRLILFLTAAVMLLSLAFSSLFTMIAMLSQNKAMVAVICILTAFLMLIAATYINGRLSEPESYPGYAYNTADQEGEAVEMENPNYLEGTEREVYQFLLDFLPGGQAVQCATMEVLHPYRLPVYSLLIIAGTTAAGAYWFSKKDLK